MIARIAPRSTAVLVALAYDDHYAEKQKAML